MNFHFSTVVWGAWHTGVFLDVNLPSLLAPGNLAAFAERHSVTYRIFTSHSDRLNIERSPAFQAASKIVQFEFIACAMERVAEPIAMHHALWRRSIDDARKAGAMILFVPPDVIWSDGSFRHVAEKFSQGKQAVFMTYMRVVSETCVPAVRDSFSVTDEPIIQASGRQLVATMLMHIHPLTLTYQRDSENFPIHPEFILWPVAGEGFLMRVLVREMFAFDPNYIDLNKQSLPAHTLDPEKVHYITDSDDLFSLSLAPLMKDIEWYAKKNLVNSLEIGSWWLKYDSPSNDFVYSHYFRIHHADCTATAWRSAELQSDFLLRRIAGTREVLRLLNHLEIADRDLNTLGILRKILSLGFIKTRLSSFVGAAKPLTLFLPDGEALLHWNFQDVNRGTEKISSKYFLKLMVDHAVIEPLQLIKGQEMHLETLSGGARKLIWVDEQPYIDGAKINLRGITLGMHTGFLIDKVLPEI